VGAWTEAEEQVLKTNFGSVARKELLRLLPGRTYRGIKQKALNLGLLKRPSEEELRAQVRAGRSLRQMGERFNLDGKTIHRYCRKYEITLRSQPEATSLANRTKIPDALFAPPLKPAQSWVLGIVATDGSISDGGRLRVISVERGVLEQCRSATGVGTIRARSATDWTEQQQFVWDYTSQELRSRLASFGVEPRKTFALRFPDVSDVHLPSFARGLWDGDGYWNRNNDGVLSGGFGSSSREFIGALWERLKPIVESEARVYKHPSKEHWVIRVDRGRARRLARWMYQEPCNVCCERKREVTQVGHKESKRSEAKAT
jgi:hypothetical protein